MPELPEVETLRRELDKVLKNKKIKSAEVLWHKTVAPLSVAEFEKQVKGKTIKKVGRFAKMLIVNFAEPSALATHLKMTGQLIYEPKTGKAIVGGHPAPQDEKNLPNKHTRLVLSFSDGSTLYFNDLRKFGWVRFIDEDKIQTLTGTYGPEPLSKNFSAQVLSDIFKRFPNRTIKQVLMDQTLIAGIGNIYADESCFISGLLPTRKVSTLKPSQIKKLYEAIVSVLSHSIKMKGTSSRNYRRSNGEMGGFVPYLLVYGREKQTCKKCGKPIEKVKHAGRGTHYCSHCQK